ncbi:MAG: hypothetical protein IT258_06260 [Saprospiraceae bacterium]|nr:hypothetical protein [Saprospiraceae bacterium]
MKRHFTLLLTGIMACLSLTSFGQTCTGNLLTNPGFESGLSGWNTSGMVTISTSANTGSNAAKVGETGYASIGFFLPTTPGTAYTAKVWAKFTGSNYQLVELRFLNSDWVTLPGAAQAAPATTTYAEYTLNGTAPTGAAYVYVIASKDGSGSIEVDDWCLTTSSANTCSNNLGEGEILCTEKSGSNLLVYLMNNQAVTEYTLDGQGTVVSTQDIGLWVQDSVLVQGNEVSKKLIDGTIAYTKTIPQSVLNTLPVVQAATELTDGTFVLAGYRKSDIANPPSYSQNNLVMVHANANLSPIEVKSISVSFNINPYYTYSDIVYGLYPAPNGAFDIFHTRSVTNSQNDINLVVSRFSFSDPQSFNSVVGVATNVLFAQSKLTKTPCGSYRFSGSDKYASQSGNFFGQKIMYFDLQDLSLISEKLSGTGSIDHYGGFNRWAFKATPPDSLYVDFQYRPNFDPVPDLQFVIPNPGQPPLGVSVPYFNYDHAVVMQPNDVFLFGSNNGQVFVEVPTDCSPAVLLQPDLTGDGLSLPSNPVVMQGNVVSFDYNLKNIGNYGIASSSYIGITYYLSSDAVLSADDIVANNSSKNGIGAGATSTVHESIYLSTNVPTGSYYVLVKIDANNTYLESDESNNLLVSAQPFTLTVNSGPPPKPDLTIFDLRTPSVPVAAGEILSYNFDVQNEGTAAASGNFTIKSYISTNHLLSANDILVGTIQAGNYGAGFAVQDMLGTSTIPASLAAGQYYLLIKIDADGDIVESNEYNNLTFSLFEVEVGGSPCAATAIATGPSEINISGFNAPHILIKIYKPDWTVAFECLDDDCDNPLVVSGLGNGLHHVDVKLFDSSWVETCHLDQDVNVSSFGGGGSSKIAKQDDRFNLSFEKFYPSPAAFLVNMDLFSAKKQAATLDFYDQQGRAVHTMKLQLEKGSNTIELLVNDWQLGTYNVIARGEETGLPAYGRFLKLWEE